MGERGFKEDSGKKRFVGIAVGGVVKEGKKRMEKQNLILNNLPSVQGSSANVRNKRTASQNKVCTYRKRRKHSRVRREAEGETINSC